MHCFIFREKGKLAHEDCPNWCDIVDVLSTSFPSSCNYILRENKISII